MQYYIPFTKVTFKIIVIILKENKNQKIRKQELYDVVILIPRQSNESRDCYMNDKADYCNVNMIVGLG